MNRTDNYFTLSLLLEGIILAGVGFYFIFLRPPLLPEDFNYINTDVAEINHHLPGLFMWLKKVFVVLGGYIFATGLVISYLAVSVGKEQTVALFIVIFLAGLSSIGLMTVINFIINSDFKWILLLFTVPWAISLILYFPRSQIAITSSKR